MVAAFGARQLWNCSGRKQVEDFAAGAGGASAARDAALASAADNSNMRIPNIVA
jgi:hypothetical protein